MTSTKVKVYIITRTAHLIGCSGEFIYGVFSSLEKATKYLKDYAHFILQIQTLEGLYEYMNVYEYTLDDDTHCRKIPLEELKEENR